MVPRGYTLPSDIRDDFGNRTTDPAVVNDFIAVRGFKPIPFFNDGLQQVEQVYFPPYNKNLTLRDAEMLKKIGPMRWTDPNMWAIQRQILDSHYN